MHSPHHPLSHLDRSNPPHTQERDHSQARGRRVVGAFGGTNRQSHFRTTSNSAGTVNHQLRWVMSPTGNESLATFSNGSASYLERRGAAGELTASASPLEGVEEGGCRRWGLRRRRPPPQTEERGDCLTTSNPTGLQVSRGTRHVERVKTLSNQTIRLTRVIRRSRLDNDLQRHPRPHRTVGPIVRRKVGTSPCIQRGEEVKGWKSVMGKSCGRDFGRMVGPIDCDVG